MYTTILFDFYDVIRVDPYKKWLSDHGYEREGFWHIASQDYDRGLIDKAEFVVRLSKESGVPAHEISQAFIDACIFDEDVISLISALKEKYRIGLVSNSGGPALRKVLIERDIEHYFHEIVISGEVGHIKPEPKIFEIALERLNVQASEAVFIDDNPHNLTGSQEVGIQGILFESAPQLQSELQALGITF